MCLQQEKILTGLDADRARGCPFSITFLETVASVLRIQQNHMPLDKAGVGNNTDDRSPIARDVRSRINTLPDIIDMLKSYMIESFKPHSKIDFNIPFLPKLAIDVTREDRRDGNDEANFTALEVQIDHLLKQRDELLNSKCTINDLDGDWGMYRKCIEALSGMNRDIRPNGNRKWRKLLLYERDHSVFKFSDATSKLLHEYQKSQIKHRKCLKKH